jgi:hypothetical protein
VVRVAHHFSFLCCVFVLCHLSSPLILLPMSLDCPFLNYSSVFSNVYVQRRENGWMSDFRKCMRQSSVHQENTAIYDWNSFTYSN